GLFLISSTAYRGSSNPEQLGRDLVRLARQLGRSTEAASQLGQLETEAEAPLAEATRLLAADSVGVVNSLLSVACGAATEDCGLWSWREPLTVARAAAQCPEGGLVRAAQEADRALLHLPRLPGLVRLSEQLAADPDVVADAVKMDQRKRQSAGGRLQPHQPLFLTRLAKQRPEMAEQISHLQAAWHDLRPLL
uniref:FATC domain-containing protein n=1 Tax=Macrostomum lignano TaxID=282301 RepID=A0A1I8GKT5_9PLAT